MIRELIVNYFIYMLLNIPLYLFNEYGNKYKILHKILSCINILIFCLIFIIGLSKINPLYIVFVPVILLIGCPISNGIIEELNNEEISGLVTGRLSPSIKLGFAKIVTFPFLLYYYMEIIEEINV